MFQFIRKYSGHEKLRQRKVHDKLNEAVSYNPSHLNRRRQYGSPPINYYQNYVSTVRQYFKQQNPKNVKPSFKRLPSRYEPTFLSFRIKIMSKDLFMQSDKA